MGTVNYQKELDEITDDILYRRAHDSAFTPPKLLIHACCAPCSSYCLEYLREYFDITVFYYNPNISSFAEYDKRYREEERLIGIYNDQVDRYRKNGVTEFDAGMKVGCDTGYISLAEAAYNEDEFYTYVRGYEACPERGERCTKCFELRLGRTYEYAVAAGGFDYISTTLTLSPLKDSDRINRIGYGICKDVAWLPGDFKKRDGYKRSIELSGAFGLYRQNYCGCIFSMRDGQRKDEG